MSNEVNDPAESPNGSGEQDKVVNESKSAEEAFYGKEGDDPDKPSEEKPPEGGNDPDKKAAEAAGEDDPEKPDEDPDGGDSEEPEKTDKVPDKYEFMTDEDTPLSDEDLTGIAKYAKERGLTNDQAQKIVDMQESALKSQKENLQEQAKLQRADWYDAAKSDKEIGGENFEKNIELSKRVLDRFATREFRDQLDESGFGNHPELIRTFVKIGNAMADDTLVQPGSHQSVKPKSDSEIFYPNSTN